MEQLFKVLFTFLERTINKVITQDFKPEGYRHFTRIPFTTHCDICFKGLRPLIRYRNKVWEDNRDKFMIELHGVTNAELSC